MRHGETSRRIPKALVAVPLAATALIGLAVFLTNGGDKSPEHADSTTPSQQSSPEVTVVDERPLVSPGPPPITEPVEPPIATNAASLDDQSTTAQEKIESLKVEELAAARGLLDTFPDDIDAVILIGNVQSRQGNTKEAVRWWQRCAELAPDRADSHVGMGDVAFQKGDFQQAVQSWHRAIEIEPAVPGIHGRLAGALMNLGETEEAISHFQQDIEQSPRAAKSLFFLGQAQAQLKNYAEAKQNYLKAVEIWPDFWNAYYALAKVCAKLGQKEDARKYQDTFKQLKAQELGDLIDRATSFDDLASVQKGVAKTLNSVAGIHQSHGDSTQAVAFWQRAATIDPEDVVSRRTLAAIFQADGRFAEAMQRHNELTSLEPNNSTHFIGLGVMQVRIGQLDVAEKTFAHAIELAPDDATGYRMLAAVYLKQNDHLAEAKQLAAKAVRLDPSATNYFALGESLDKNGDRPGALAAIKKAVDLDPTNSNYRRVYSYLVKQN